MGVQKYRHDQLTQNIARARTVKVRPVQTKKTADDNAPQPTYWDEDTRGITVVRQFQLALNCRLSKVLVNKRARYAKGVVTNKQGQTMGKELCFE